MENSLNREKIIVRTSIIGILSNLFLSFFKAIVGLSVKSIAILMDALNNLTDAMSSIVTIIGIKLANKEANREHPFGHGRIEYLTAMFISLFILYAGITSLIESIKKILEPEIPSYTNISFLIISVAVIVKIFLGLYVKSVGEKVNSDSLIASGNDAKFDAIISLSTLFAGIIYIFFKIKIEAYLGIAISIVIIKAGYGILKETVADLIGERIDSKIAKDIKDCINSFDEVLGTYDLIIHNYGPNVLVGSAHIEVSDKMTAYEIDTLEREITKKVYNEFKVYITGLSIYSSNNNDKKISEMKDRIDRILDNFPHVMQMHGFYLDEIKKIVKFDVVISFDDKEKHTTVKNIINEISKYYPDYEFQITIDNDISD